VELVSCTDLGRDGAGGWNAASPGGASLGWLRLRAEAHNAVGEQAMWAGWRGRGAKRASDLYEVRRS
jgi:hypothetical protein